MKLLLDQNLSRRLTRDLQAQYPGGQHASALGLDTASDLEVWTHAGTQGFVIVSKDSDFRDLVQRLGAPPKIVHLDVGNCSTSDVLALLTGRVEVLLAFEQGEEDLLVITRSRDS